MAQKKKPNSENRGLELTGGCLICGRSLGGASVKCTSARLPSKGLQISQHRWNEFRDGGMDVHRALHDRVRRLCIDQIKNAMYHLIAADAQNGCAQYLARFL